MVGDCFCLKLFLSFFWQKDGDAAVFKIPVVMPPDHRLCVPGEWTYCQPDTALYLTSVAGQQATGPQDQRQTGLLHCES